MKLMTLITASIRNITDFSQENRRTQLRAYLCFLTLAWIPTSTCQAATIAWNLTESEIERLLPEYLPGTDIPRAKINGATFASGSRGSGSGMFRDLMRLQAPGKGGVQTGLNRDSDGALDESFLGGNTNLMFSDLAEDRSGTHFVFNVDFNEGGGKNSLISLDEIRIYVSDSTDIATPVQSVSALETALGPGSNSAISHVFSMGSNAILADAGIVPGSGKSDLDIYIPKTFFGNRAPDDLVYIYSEMGGFHCHRRCHPHWTLQSLFCCFESYSGTLWFGTRIRCRNSPRLYSSANSIKSLRPGCAMRAPFSPYHFATTCSMTSRVSSMSPLV